MKWEEFQSEIKALAAKIDVSVDIIVGIVRGGVIPARLLSSELGTEEMYFLTVKKSGKDREVVSDILENIAGKQILLVEDVLESGRSLIAAKQFLERKGAVVKTACLYTMEASEIKPNYSLKEINQAIAFPWE